MSRIVLNLPHQQNSHSNLPHQQVHVHLPHQQGLLTLVPHQHGVLKLVPRQQVILKLPHQQKSPSFLFHQQIVKLMELEGPGRKERSMGVNQEQSGGRRMRQLDGPCWSEILIQHCLLVPSTWEEQQQGSVLHLAGETQSRRLTPQWLTIQQMSQSSRLASMAPRVNGCG